MPLNKSKGNMYPWVTHTWNPIRGCQHNCIYCYVKSLTNYNMIPRFVEKELNTNLGYGRTIFVCSTGDMFGAWVPDKWIYKVLNHCKKFDNTYLFQSKNPRRFVDLLPLIPNIILGTTIETNREEYRGQAPERLDRVESMIFLRRFFKTMISIEPIMDFDVDEMFNLLDLIRPEFVSIGADSKNHNLPEPSADKIRDLIIQLKGITKVKIKQNLRRLGAFE